MAADARVAIGAGAINRVCVVGAGVMGAGIAAQVANGGTPVLLLDVVKPGETDRNALAKAAVARMLKAEPAAFMSAAAARLVETGNVEDDLARVAECDWIVEAVVEDVEAKRDLYRRLDAVRRPGTAVSSNTSTIPLAKLVEGLSDAFAQDFLVIHFFNPPRYMRLLELVAGPRTDPALVARVGAFCDRVLGKTVVRAKDTPGFIANRIGGFWLQRAVNAAFDLGLSVEEADAVMGAPLGFPKTGVFGLLDLVGLDLMPHIDASMRASLPADDPFVVGMRETPLIARMIGQGLTGRKGAGGFYRLDRTAGAVKQSIGLITGEYAPSRRFVLPGPPKDPAALLAQDDRYGDYARRVMVPTLAYASSLVPQISDDVAGVDAAMRLGFNWKWGPFELMDRLGPKALADRLGADGAAVPPLLAEVGEGRFYREEDGRRLQLAPGGGYAEVPRPEGVVTLADVKRAAGGRPLLKTASAAAWDLGDGVVGVEFTAKLNALDEATMTLLNRAIALVEETHRAMVVYSDAAAFSAGANLGLALFAANIAAWGEIERLVRYGQETLKALKYAPFPVVAGPAGLALGGGCETCLHADAIVAHAETYMGLVECGVGLVPGWGGCGEMLRRYFEASGAARGPMPAVMRAFETISTAKVSKSAAEAKAIGYLRETDEIVMNRDRLLAAAKAKALSLVEGYVPPVKPEFRLPGASGRTALTMAAQDYRRRGIATDYDLVVAGELAGVLSGGEADPLDIVGEDQMMALERAAFLRLIRRPETLARIEHTLQTGKPLRN